MVRGLFSIDLGAPTDASRRARKDAQARPLDCFVGGDENALVAVACRDTLSDSPRFCPLVFVGPPGTGKSLLACGLATQWHRRHPHSRALVMPGADFARALAHAYETDSLHEFRQRFARHSRVVIEDVQEIANKEPAQHELSRLIDTQLERGGQLLATVQQLPHEMQLTAPLTSRLSAGLTVPLSPPGRAARCEILRRLANRRELRLSERTISILAGDHEAAPFATVPQLVHALSQLQLLAEEEQIEITPELAERLVRDATDRREPALRAIVTRVARHFQLRAAELRGPSRRQAIAQSRGVAMLLARRLTSKSLEEIGRHFGNRDHTTVLHACRATTRRLDKDPSLRAACDGIAMRLMDPQG